MRFFGAIYVWSDNEIMLTASVLKAHLLHNGYYVKLWSRGRILRGMCDPEPKLFRIGTKTHSLALTLPAMSANDGKFSECHAPPVARSPNFSQAAAQA